MRSGKKSKPWGSNFPNLKGKKTKSLNCQCCVAENRKEEVFAKEAEKEVKQVLEDINGNNSKV